MNNIFEQLLPTPGPARQAGLTFFRSSALRIFPNYPSAVKKALRPGSISGMERSLSAKVRARPSRSRARLCLHSAPVEDTGMNHHLRNLFLSATMVALSAGVVSGQSGLPSAPVPVVPGSPASDG